MTDHLDTAARVGDAGYPDVFQAADMLVYPDAKWWRQGFAKVQLPDVPDLALPSRPRTLRNQAERLSSRRNDLSAREVSQRLASSRPLPRESKARASARAASWRHQNAREREFSARYARIGRLSKEATAWNADPSPTWTIKIGGVAEAVEGGQPRRVGVGVQHAPEFIAPPSPPHDRIRKEYLETGRAAVRTNAAKHKGKPLSSIHNRPSETASVFPTTVTIEMKGFNGKTFSFTMYAQDDDDIGGTDEGEGNADFDTNDFEDDDDSF